MARSERGKQDLHCNFRIQIGQKPKIDESSKDAIAKSGVNELMLFNLIDSNPISNALPPSLCSSTSCSKTMRSRRPMHILKPIGLVVMSFLLTNEGEKISTFYDIRSLGTSMDTVEHHDQS